MKLNPPKTMTCRLCGLVVSNPVYGQLRDNPGRGVIVMSTCDACREDMLSSRNRKRRKTVATQPTEEVPVLPEREAVSSFVLADFADYLV